MEDRVVAVRGGGGSPVVAAILSGDVEEGGEVSPERVAWDLRRAWDKGTCVAVTLRAGRMIRLVVGRVEHVAVSGAFAVIDGWHVPLEDVNGHRRATQADKDAYSMAMERLLTDM